MTTGGDGSYELGAVSGPPTTPYAVTVSADGFLARKQWVAWQQGQRTGLTFDLIRNTAPFSMDFYKQLVRGTFDQEGAPWPVLRLATAPKFYLKTVDEQGNALAPEIFPVIVDALHRAVRDYTGGRLAAQVETGTETRPGSPGSINVLIQRDPGDRSACGWAYVGRDPGEITLIYDLAGCACGSVKVSGSVVVHEVGHALGFFHVNDKSSVMYPFAPGSCPAGILSAAERHHAAIAYSRPRGNTDPDDDPASGRLSTAAAANGGIRIKN